MARVQKFFTQPSRTKQSFKDECDVNLIMKRFKKVMGSDYLSRYNSLVGGDFLDVSLVSDYRSALDQVKRASAVFDALPAIVRSKFANDPARFVDFCHKPENLPELAKMGLTKSVTTPVKGGLPVPPAG